MLLCLKKIFSRLFLPIPEKLLSSTIPKKKKTKLQRIISVYCVLKLTRQLILEILKMKQLFLSIHLISVPMSRRMRGHRCFPQDAPLLQTWRIGTSDHWCASGNRDSGYSYRCKPWLCLQSYFWRQMGYSCACQCMGGKYHEASSKEETCICEIKSFTTNTGMKVLWLENSP